ncbi:MAG: Uma2 family endonuclease [Oscillatoriales cyanobacterium]|nr:MAG: Uma2 family endonuclease [Oscillatoriales cyanobacterium]
MVQAPARSISLDEFLKQPETQPASEYINGTITHKPIPQGKHSSIQTELASLLNLSLRRNKIARAFSELRCTFDDRSIIPDISVFSWSRIVRDDNGEIANMIDRAPDWTIEILSPGQSQTRVTKNILTCLDHGSELGWLIDPEERAVLVFLPGEPIHIVDKLSEALPVPGFAKDLTLTVDDVFSLLLE